MVGGRNGWFIKESEVVKSVGMQRDRGNWFHFSVSLYSVAKSTAGSGAGWGRRFGANVVSRVSQASFSQPKKKKKKKKINDRAGPRPHERRHIRQNRLASQLSPRVARSVPASNHTAWRRIERVFLTRPSGCVGSWANLAKLELAWAKTCTWQRPLAPLQNLKIMRPPAPDLDHGSLRPVSRLGPSGCVPG
ncbi:hypothetical protein QG37_00219 [Candidozyma auris]|nr:hypothetical protein QG37_00219 [[Candida] auris]